MHGEAGADQRKQRGTSVQRRGGTGGLTFAGLPLRQESIESRASSRSRMTSGGSCSSRGSRARETSADSRKSSRRGSRSSGGGDGGGGGGGVLRGRLRHRGKRSGEGGGGDSGSALSVSSRGSSRSDHSSVARFDKWRDRLDRLPGGKDGGDQKLQETAGIYRRVGHDGSIRDERVVDGDRSSNSQSVARSRNSSGRSSVSGRGDSQIGGSSGPPAPGPDVMSLTDLVQVAPTANSGKVSGKGGSSSAHRRREDSARTTERGTAHESMRGKVDMDMDVDSRARSRDHAANAGSKRSDGSTGDVGRDSSRTRLDPSGKRRGGRRGHEHYVSPSSSSAVVSTRSRKETATDAAAPLPRSSDREDGRVLGFEDTTMSAARKAALTAADSGSLRASFSEDIAGGGGGAHILSTLNAVAESFGDGDGTSWRRAPDAAEKVRQHGSRRKGKGKEKEDGQQQQRPSSRQKETPATAGRSAKGDAEPVAGSVHERPNTAGKSSSRRAHSSKASASAGGDRGAVVPGGAAREGVGRRSSSSRRVTMAPSASAEGYAQGEEGEQDGGDGVEDEDEELARAAAAVVASAVAEGRAASASEGAVDHEAIFAAAERTADEGASRAAASEGTQFYAQRTSRGGGSGGGGSDAQRSSSSGTSRRASHTKDPVAADATHAAAAWRGSHLPVAPRQAPRLAPTSSASAPASSSVAILANCNVTTCPPPDPAVDLPVQDLPKLSSSSSSSKARSRSHRRGAEEKDEHAHVQSADGTSRSGSTSRVRAATTTGERRSVPTRHDRGRSRERRGGGGGGGGPTGPGVAAAAAALGEAGTGAGSVVQSTGAAAAAAARADDGGYGSEWDKLEVGMDREKSKLLRDR